MQLLLRVAFFVVLIPMTGVANDPMDTSEDVASAVRRPRRTRAYVPNAAEPVVPLSSPAPSFAILRSQDNPMNCAYILEPQKNQQWALVPWGHKTSSACGYKIVSCSYAQAIREYSGIQSEQTFLVTGLSIINTKSRFYGSFDNGLKALQEKVRLESTIVAREHYSRAQGGLQSLSASFVEPRSKKPRGAGKSSSQQ